MAKQGPPMRQKLRTQPHTGVPSIFLLMALALVYCVGWLSGSAAQRSPTAKAAAVPRIYYGTAELPGPVQEMREAILSAVSSGRIEELRQAYDLNELKPDLAAEPVADPVTFWREISADGRGLEVLAALGALTSAQEVEFMRLLGAATARELKQKGRYSSWRIAIGADGVWHSFRKIP